MSTVMAADDIATRPDDGPGPGVLPTAANADEHTFRRLLVNTLVYTPKQALIGLALIALGLPVYFYWTRTGGGGAMTAEEQLARKNDD